MENTNEVLPTPQPVQPTPIKKWYANKAVMVMLILVILAASSLTVYFILNQPQNLGPVVVSHLKANEQNTANNNSALTNTTSPAGLATPASSAITPTSSQPTTDTNNCATSKLPSYCYAKQAEAQKNPAVCKQASSQDVVAYCYLQVATETNNLQLCPQIQVQSQKDSCYNYFAGANKDSTLCNKILDLGMRQGCLMPFQQAVASTKLNVNLDSSILSGNPGDSVKVTGQIQNSTTNILYLTGMTGSVVSVVGDPSNKGGDLTLDPTDFFSLVPPSFQPGQSYQGSIFSVQISSNAKAGTYIFSYTLEGGKTEKDLTGELWSEEVSIQVK